VPRQQKDLILRCGLCDDMRVERHKGIMKILRKKYESTLHVESILMKPFVSAFDRTKLVAFLKTPNAVLSKNGSALKRKADALLRHDKVVRKLAAADKNLEADHVTASKRKQDFGSIGSNLTSN
jgi:hypothetical protein